MADPENGSPRWRPTLPTTIVAVSVVVALVAVSALLFVLFQQTVGPGEVLRDFSRRVQDGDCLGTYGLLDPGLASEVDEEAWCDGLPALAEDLNTDFTIESTTLRSEVASLEISGDRTTEAVWLLRREGDSWRILGAGGAVDLPGA